MQVETLGTRPMEQTLSLLRQLKYIENVMFADCNPYVESGVPGPLDYRHSDVEMILLDLL
jgi:hypothetical protein